MPGDRMHFMNPVPLMKLVEVIRGLETSDETTTLVVELARKMGKTPIASKDAPGFIVNRILIPLVNEAVFALAEGVAPAEGIDQAMVLGTNQPMGPLALADRIGLDTVLAICETLYQDMGDPKFRPCPLLRKYVEAGWLGREAGKLAHGPQPTTVHGGINPTRIRKLSRVAEVTIRVPIFEVILSIKTRNGNP